MLKDHISHVHSPNSVENIINNEGADKAPSGEKRVFIVGDSIIKHINGYEISGKLEMVSFLFL